MARKDNRGPNWGKNGFDSNPERAAEAGRKGGKHKRPKEKVLDAISDGELDALIEARELFIAQMVNEAQKGEFGKMKWFAEKTGVYTENRKPVEEAKEEVKGSGELVIKVDLTVPKDGDDDDKDGE